MAILVNGNTKVLCQGITGSFGAFHTKGCHDYGTKLVGGVTPGKGGTTDANGIPIFDTVREAVAETGADATMIFPTLSRPPVPRQPHFSAQQVRVRVSVSVRVRVRTRVRVRVRSELGSG